MASLPLMAQDPVRHIFEGKSTKYWDIVYTYDDKHIYKGNSTKYWDIVYTYDDKYIYKGNSTRYWDIVYTYDKEHIYKGNSTKYWDIIFTIEKKDKWEVDFYLYRAKHKKKFRQVPNAPAWIFCIG